MNIMHTQLCTLTAVNVRLQAACLDSQASLLEKKSVISIVRNNYKREPQEGVGNYKTTNERKRTIGN